MKTTVNLPDALVEQVRERARREHRTFTSLLEEGLRLVVAATGPAGSDHEAPLPTYGEPGGRALVDVADRTALWEALDADGVR